MKSFSEYVKKMSKTDIAAAVCFFSAFVFIFVFSRFFNTISDEAFYISVPYRLLTGDGLLTDEWHLSQLSSVLLYLPLKIYVILVGSLSGVVLYFRRLFCVFQLLCAVISYKLLRDKGFIAVISCTSFMLFATIGFRTLSYNTLGVGIFFVMCCVLYSLKSDVFSFRKMFFLGFSLSCFILCQPVGIIIYPVYLIAVLVFTLYKKEKTPSYFTFKSFLSVTLGILPVFIFFLYLFFKNSDIETVIKCIPGIFSDVEHMKISEEVGIDTVSVVGFFKDMTMAAGTIPLIMLAVCFVAAVIIKKKNKSAAIILMSSALFIYTLVFYCCLYFVSDSETDDINFFLLPLSLAGLCVYLISEKKDLKTFICFYCTGIMYAVFMSISSNLRLNAEANGYFISSVGTLLLANGLKKEFGADEIKNNLIKVAQKSLTVGIFALFIFYSSAVAIEDTVIKVVYNPQDAKITEGVFEGISLPSDAALIHTKLRQDAKEMSEILSEDDRLFVLDNIPSVYLEGNFKIGCFSAWFIAEELTVDEVKDRFREYYEIFPENTPDYVYVPPYMYLDNGLDGVNAKMFTEYAYSLFDGTMTELKNGVLIKVTGVKNENK